VMAAVLMLWLVRMVVGRRRSTDFRVETAQGDAVDAHVAVHAYLSSQGIVITFYHKVNQLRVRPERAGLRRGCGMRGQYGPGRP
jgi:hypothetical protein